MTLMRLRRKVLNYRVYIFSYPNTEYRIHDLWCTSPKNPEVKSCKMGKQTSNYQSNPGIGFWEYQMSIHFSYKPFNWTWDHKKEKVKQNRALTLPRMKKIYYKITLHYFRNAERTRWLAHKFHEFICNLISLLHSSTWLLLDLTWLFLIMWIQCIA
jgi:hypothetical protein